MILRISSNQIHRDRTQNGGFQDPGEGGRGKGKFVHKYRVSVGGDEKGFGDWLYNNVNALNTT